MMPFDPTKPVVCRDGKKARIVCTDKLGPRPIVALVERGEAEQVVDYLPTGKFLQGEGEYRWDLINAPETKFRYVNSADLYPYQCAARAVNHNGAVLAIMFKDDVPVSVSQVKKGHNK